MKLLKLCIVPNTARLGLLAVVGGRRIKKAPSDIEGAKALIIFHPGADVRGIATIIPLFHFFHHLFPGDQVTEGLVHVINLFRIRDRSGR